MESNVALQLGENLALLFLSAFFYGLIINRFCRQYGKFSILYTGLLFGLIAIVAMLFPLSPTDGIIFDGRTVAVVLAGPFGGGYGSLIAALIAGAYRLILGGPGVAAGITGIGAAALLGLGYWKLRKSASEKYSISDFLIMGVLLPGVSLPTLFLLPQEVALPALGKVLLPVFIYEVVSVIILGIFLRNEVRRANMMDELLVSEQRFRDFTEIGSDYYWEMDEEGCFSYFSERFEHVTGTPRQEAVGKSRKELWSYWGSSLLDRGDVKNDLFQLIETRQPFRRVRFVIPQEHRSDRVIEISGRPCFDRLGRFRGYRGVGLDVTKEVSAVHEKEQALQTMEKARKAAVMASRAKTTFLARMSHELRSPLNAIVGFADVLSREAEGPLGTPGYRSYVKNIQMAGSHLQALIGDILDLSKIESGRLELEKVQFSWRDVVEHLRSIMVDAAKERNNRVRLELDDNLPPCVIGDPTRIRQVIVNFLSNAIKFTSGGEIVLAARKVAQDDHSVEMEISVSDTGVGMTSEEQEVVFDAFTQADVSVTRNYGGTGLGLSICKHLVESMGGEIGVESAHEEGSRFWFTVTLPWRDYAEDEDLLLLPQTAHLAPVTMLVVDDLEVNRQLVKALVTSEGHTVIEAADGAEALAIMHSDTGFMIDVILMDIHMPHMNGMETAMMMREAFDDSRSNLPIIALTADVMQENIRQYRKSGMSDVIGKPVKISELNRVLAGQGLPLAVEQDKMAASPEIVLRDDTVKGDGKMRDRADGMNNKSVDPARLSVAFGLFPDQNRAQVLDTLKSQCHEFISAAMDARKAEDSEGLRMQLHTLKGVASNIGFCGLADLCRSLENELKSKQANTDINLNDLNPALEDALQEAARQAV